MLNMLMHMKSLLQCLEHRKCSVNSDCCFSCLLPLIWRKSLSERLQSVIPGMKGSSCLWERMASNSLPFLPRLATKLPNYASCRRDPVTSFHQWNINRSNGSSRQKQLRASMTSLPWFTFLVF